MYQKLLEDSSKRSSKMAEHQQHPDPPNLIPRLQDAHQRNQSKAPPSEFNMVTATNLTPVIVAVVTILVVAFLLVSYFRVVSTCYNSWILRRNPATDTSSPHVVAATTTDVQGPAVSIIPIGLSGSIIRRIPVYRFSKSKKESLSSSDCPVCLGEFLEDEDVKMLPKCNHAFHVDCIDAWLSGHSIFCPLCRCKVELNAEDSPDLPLDAQQQAQDVQEANESGENVLEHGDTGAGDQGVILPGDMQPGDTLKAWASEKPSFKQQMSSGRKRNFLRRVSSSSSFLQIQRHDDHAADDGQASSSSNSPPRDAVVEIDSEDGSSAAAAAPNPNRGDNSVRKSTVWKMKRSLSSSRVFSFRKNRQQSSEDDDAHASDNPSQIV